MFTIMSSPIFSDAVQNSVFQVMSEGSLKAVARPLFTLVDKNGTKESKKYSATKEVIFQTLSLAFYFALVTPIVQKGGYKALRKALMEKPDFGVMKNHKDLSSFLKARSLAKTDDEAAKFIHPKGAIELTNMVGSAIILTMIAPFVVTKAVHPIMKAIEKNRVNKNPVQQNNQGDAFVKTQPEKK